MWSLALLSLPVLSQLVQAVPLLEERQGRFQAQQQCTTFYTDRRVNNVRTTTSVRTITFNPTMTVTVTPSTTITPAQSTSTSTLTSTVTSTGAGATGTFTTTSTSISTMSATITATISTTTTVATDTTTSTTTTTVPAPSNFIYPTPTNGGRKRSLESAAEDISMELVEREPQRFRNGGGRAQQGAPARFPAGVVCNRIVRQVNPVRVTRTADTTRTRTAIAPTTTITTTATTTSTVMPAAATTTTIMTTSTVSTTVSTSVTSTFSTTTTLVQPATATYYAVCGQQNQVNQDLNGNGLLIVADDGTKNQLLAANSAYDCCVACILAQNCASANYFPGVGDQACELNIFDTCPANQGQQGFIYSSGGTDGLTVSNGLCGYALYQTQ